MKSSQKFLVGAFLVGGVLLFAVGLFWIGDRRQLFDRSLELNAEFRNLSGLASGATVRVAGIDAGEVLEIQVPPGPESGFRVRFRVAERFLPILRSDSVATIQTEGIIGNQFLQVDAGSAAGQEVAAGDTLPNREPVEVADLLQQASNTVAQVRGIMTEVQEGVSLATQGVTSVTEQASQLVDGVDSVVQRFTLTSNRIAENVEEIVMGVREGRGTVGKLLTDDAIYEQLRETAQRAGQTVETVQHTAENMRETSENLRGVVADVRSSGVVDDFSQTVENVRELSDQAKGLMSTLQPGTSDEPGLSASLQQTIANANVAMANAAENTEALKRNWFFRGFFRDRGFFELDSIPIEEYRQGRFAPERVPLREWLYEGELFSVLPDGTEELSDSGRKRLDQAMAGLILRAANNPLIVEGYAAQGDAGEIFLRAQDRAAKVRAYLVRRFPLESNYVGTVPMGAVASSASGRAPWEGVALVLYLPKGSVVPPR